MAERARLSSTTQLAFAASIVAVASAVACGEDEGAVPKNCPDLPLYDVRDASQKDMQARQSAAQAGCVTGPGSATSAGGASGTGGTAGASGAAAAGSAGTAGAGGNDAGSD